MSSITGLAMQKVLPVGDVIWCSLVVGGIMLTHEWLTTFIITIIIIRQHKQEEKSWYFFCALQSYYINSYLAYVNLY